MEARLTLLLLFVAYVGYYLCRVTFVVAKPELESGFGLSKEDTGLILSTYIAVYAVSKLVNGFLGDKVGGKLMLLLGMAGTVACNVAFGFGREMGVFLLIWAVNAYFQSAGWPAMTSIMSQWFTSRQGGRAMGVLSLSYQLGDVLARLVGGALILAVGWAGMFWIHAALLVFVGLLIGTTLKPAPATTTIEAPNAYARQMRSILGAPVFWFLCATYFFISILRYSFWNWSVEYLKENVEMDTGGAAMASSIYPLCGAVGTVFIGWVSDRLDARRGPVVILSCGLLCGAVYTLGRVPASPVPVITMLGVIGFLVYGPYALMAGAMAIDLGSRHSSSTAAGILDAVGAAGAILAGYAGGRIIEQDGWSSASQVVLNIALVTTVVSCGLWRFRPITHQDS